MDAIGREHQCATIPDFQLPQRFDLEYVDLKQCTTAGDDTSRDTGFVERMFGILCEHYGGRWPMWLPPRQVAICK